MTYRRSPRPEDAVMRAVFQHFERRAAPNVVAFHVPNGGKRPRVESAIMKGLGVVSGVPDVVAVKDGQFYALELKSDKGKRPADNQLAVQARLRAAGAIVGTTYGLDASLAQLESWGLLRGRAS